MARSPFRPASPICPVGRKAQGARSAPSAPVAFPWRPASCPVAMRGERGVGALDEDRRTGPVGWRSPVAEIPRRIILANAAGEAVAADDAHVGPAQVRPIAGTDRADVVVRTTDQLVEATGIRVTAAANAVRPAILADARAIDTRLVRAALVPARAAVALVAPRIEADGAAQRQVILTEALPAEADLAWRTTTIACAAMTVVGERIDAVPAATGLTHFAAGGAHRNVAFADDAELARIIPVTLRADELAPLPVRALARVGVGCPASAPAARLRRRALSCPIRLAFALAFLPLSIDQTNVRPYPRS